MGRDVWREALGRRSGGGDLPIAGPSDARIWSEMDDLRYYVPQTQVKKKFLFWRHTHTHTPFVSTNLLPSLTRAHNNQERNRRGRGSGNDKGISRGGDSQKIRKGKPETRRDQEEGQRQKSLEPPRKKKKVGCQGDTIPTYLVPSIGSLCWGSGPCMVSFG
jgi:hypothetical protein